MRPPLPVLMRVAAEDTTLSGHSIPKGTMIYCSVSILMANPKYWPAPQNFKPERLPFHPPSLPPAPHSHLCSLLPLTHSLCLYIGVSFFWKLFLPIGLMKTHTTTIILCHSLWVVVHALELNIQYWLVLFLLPS